MVYQRISLTLGVFAHLGWTIPLFFILSNPEMDLRIASFFSKLIFFSGSLVAPIFIHYALLLIEPRLAKNSIYLTLQGYNVIVQLAVLFGYVENGVVKTEEGIRPVFGPLIELTFYAKFAALILVGFITWEIVKKYINTAYMEHQERIAVAVLLTVFLGILSNIVLPVFFNSDKLIIFGPLAFFILYVYILADKSKELKFIFQLPFNCIRTFIFKTPILISIVLTILLIIYLISVLNDLP